MRAIAFILLFGGFFCHAQTGLFVNGMAASLRVDSSGFLSVEGDFHNLDCDPVSQVRFNGSLYLAGSLINNDTLKFSATTGNGNSKKARIIFRNSVLFSSGITASISGVAVPRFWEVELDKPGGSVTLYNHVRCSDTLNFVNGFIYMNGRTWTLVDPVGAVSVMNHPYIRNERNLSQFLPVSLLDSGRVMYNTVYSSSLNLNPGNIGITFQGLLDIGSGVSFVRGFYTQVNAGKSSLHTYFDIFSPAYGLISNTVSLRYRANDFSYFSPGYISLPSVQLFVSQTSNNLWSPLRSTVQNVLVNTPGPLADGLLSADLSDLQHPHLNLDGKNIRLTIADPLCANPPVSALLLDTVHICVGDTLILDAGNNTAIPNTTLRWEWNSSPVSYDRTITTTPDTIFKKIKVTLMDVRGCVTKDSVIVAPAAPFPQITYLNHLNACLGDSATIKDTVTISSGSFSNFWLFSDGSTDSTLSNQFRKKFSQLGQHSLQLTSVSNHGCASVSNATNIVTYPLPAAVFSSSLNCLNDVVSFTNSSVSNYSTLVISNSLWNFGQGVSDTSSLFSPQRTFSASGVYSVQLRVTSSFGCRDSVVNQVTIYPRNQVQFSKNNVCDGDTVYLNDQSTCNTGSCSVIWSGGDGSLYNTVNIKKVYTNPGLYQVKLKVTAPVGCPDSLTTAVFVNARPVSQFSLSAADVCLNEFVYGSNTSSISAGNMVSDFWDYGDGNTASTFNGSNSYTQAGIYNMSLTVTSDSGCVSTVGYPVTVHPQPFAAFSANTVCEGLQTQLVSSSTGNNLVYQWNYGNSVLSQTSTSSVQNYLYPVAGNYSVTLFATDVWTCSDTAGVTVTVLTRPQAGMGGAVSTCGTSLTLNAGNPGASYFWLPGGQLSQTIVAANTGTYEAVITGTNGCGISETVSVTLNSIVIPTLGNDTSVCGNYILDAGYPGSTFLWNTGALSQTLVAVASGSFAVMVTDQNGCTGADTIQLIVKTPAFVSLGPDLSICKPSVGYLLNPSNNVDNFSWSSGASTSTLNVNNSGSYWVHGIAANGCEAGDTINISFLNTPFVDLGTDKVVCGGLTLDAKNGGSSYLWNSGSGAPFIYAATSGSYAVVVTNTITGCSHADTVNVLAHPNVTVFLGRDTSVCDNTGFILNAGNDGATYLWTDGSIDQTMDLRGSGVYGVTVTSPGGCVASDYINISLRSAPVIQVSGNKLRYICGSKPFHLSTTNKGTILWGSEYGSVSSSENILVTQPGKHWLNVMDAGCSASDTILVIASSQTIEAQFLASTQDTVNRPVQFVNLSTPAPVSQTWFFGDGSTSNELHPVHTFVLPKEFGVTLEVSNGYCSDRITKNIQVLFKTIKTEQPGQTQRLEMLAFSVYPNPASTELMIEMAFNVHSAVQVRLMDLSGRIIKEENVSEGLDHRTAIDVSTCANGLYLLSIHSSGLKGEVRKTVKFIKN